MRICCGCNQEKECQFQRKFCKDCLSELEKKKYNEINKRHCEHCNNVFISTNKYNICSTKCRILSKIIKINDCWEWQGSYRGQYGTISYQGKSKSTHRASYLIFKGEIKKGLCVLHRCDNPKCCNPDHLFLGTSKENTQDMIKKNRKKVVAGEKVHSAILTEDKVLKIRELHKNGLKIKEIASIFRIKYFTCLDVVNRRNWCHI